MTRINTTVPLGTSEIKTLIAGLRNLSTSLKPGGELIVEMEQSAAREIATEVRKNVASITDIDGNILGADSAAVTVEVGLPGHDVIWRGDQIGYLEFGTGARGAEGGYSNPAMLGSGYAPDASKDKWVYKSRITGRPTLSHGLAPQAPMDRAARAIRLRGLPIIKRLFRKAVRDAVIVR